MRRSGDRRQSIAVGDGSDHISALCEFIASIEQFRANAGRDLNLGALVLCTDAVAQHGLAFIEQLSSRFVDESACPRADEEVFLLDAEREGLALAICHGFDQLRPTLQRYRSPTRCSGAVCKGSETCISMLRLN